MDDYKINQIGQITFWRRTNAKSTHRIFAGKDNITFGKQFVSQLVEKQSANGTTAKTSNSDDAFEFFKFAADHTKVEWSLIGLQKNNSVEFKLHSDFSTSSVSLDTKDYKDQVFQLHNHPRGVTLTIQKPLEIMMLISRQNPIRQYKVIMQKATCGH